MAAEPMVVAPMVNLTKLKAKGWNSKSKFLSIFSSCREYKYVPSVIAEIISFDGGSINDDTDDDLDHQGKISVAPIVGFPTRELMRQKKHEHVSKKSLRLCS